MEQILLPSGKVHDGHRKYPVQVMIHISDGRFQFLPQNLLFFSRSTILRNLLRVRCARQKRTTSGEQGEAKRSFEHGDLRVGVIIRRKSGKNAFSTSKNL